MTSTPSFTLSLDCEGLWGMADQPAVLRAAAIRQDTLTDAYECIRRVLIEQDALATCAFVSAFAAGKQILHEERRTLRLMADHSPTWFTHSLPCVLNGNGDGWDGEEFYRRLREDGHDMGWHGGTHIPLADTTPGVVVDLDLLFSERVFASLGERPTSVVFPRNDVGHLARLRQAGFSTYRAARPAGAVARILSVLREWNVKDAGVHVVPTRRDDWVVSPPGFFLNWPSGIRKMVPLEVTVTRWQSLLRTAAMSGGHVHMWFHPHNLITAPPMREAFASILRYVGELARSGDIKIVTMADTARAVSARLPSAYGN